jgi:hypothetical protein
MFDVTKRGNQEGITENHQENPYAERFRTQRLG